MSLKVWLPLNGNLNNQGLSNINVINENATINTVGKIGSCYEFNGSTSRITINYLDAFKGGSNQFTYCSWIYDDDNNARSIYLGDYGTTGAININIEKNASNKVRFYWNGSPDKVFNAVIPNQQWVHLAITYDGSIIKCYLNGVLQDSLTQALSEKNKTSGFYGIGRDNRSDTTAFKGMMNDFRLYDECLSLKQIKEIAKGLVCHYKFDGIRANENFILRSDKVTSSGGATGITRTITDGILKVEAAEGNGNWCTVGFAANSNTNVGEKMSVGDSYTVSCDIMVESGNNFPTLFINNGNGYRRLGGGDITKLNEWQRVYYSNTWNEPGTQYGNISLHLGFSGLIGTYYFKNFKLEKGNFTKWIPAPTDPEYTIWGYDKIFKQDCSGFNYNATKIGTLTFNFDSPRYDGSTYFNGSALLNNSLGTVLANSKDFTISGWFNRTSGTCYYAGASSSTVPVCLENARFFIYNASGASKVGNWSCTNNVWQHLTLVHNSTAQTLTLYINGIQNQQITTDGTIYNRETLNIGGRNNGGQFVGSISDFRIYATALSAEEILTLYKNSGIIDNNGNVYTREFKEV